MASCPSCSRKARACTALLRSSCRQYLAQAGTWGGHIGGPPQRSVRASREPSACKGLHAAAPQGKGALGRAMSREGAMRCANEAAQRITGGHRGSQGGKHVQPMYTWEDGIVLVPQGQAPVPAPAAPPRAAWGRQALATPAVPPVRAASSRCAHTPSEHSASGLAQAPGGGCLR